MEWKDIFIFISSTFNDMHAERSYLISSVFPELRNWCERHFLHLYDIDLRWGISEDDAGDVAKDDERQRVIKKCLDGIDSCKPFFLCLLGQRRGWIPNKRIVPDDAYSESLIPVTLQGNHSITEMEILHSLTNQGQSAKDHCLFLFRDPAYLNLITDTLSREIYCDSEENLYHLKQFKSWLNDTYPGNCANYLGQWSDDAFTPEIYKSDCSEEDLQRMRQGRFTDFKTSESTLREFILLFFKEKIKIAFPDYFADKHDSPLTSVSQEYYISSQTVSYVRFEEHENIFLRFLSSNSKSTFVLMSAPGGGKTAFLANAVQKIDGVKILRFIGTSALFADETQLYRSILKEFAILGIIDIEHIPFQDFEIKPFFLSLIRNHVFKNPVTIIIDGFDRLDDFKNLSWLPVELTENVKLIVSVNSNSVTDGLLSFWKRKGVTVFTIPELDTRQVRLITEKYLQLYLKKFDETNMKELLTLPQVSNPLDLRLIVSELRVFGSFEQLLQKIRTDFGNTTESIITEVILRLEQEHSFTNDRSKFIRLFFGFIAISFKGLPLEDLTQLMIGFWGTQAPAEENLRMEIHSLLYQLNPFFYTYNDVISFAYPEIKSATLKHYAEICNDLRKELIWYYGEQKKAIIYGTLSPEKSKKSFQELPYQLSMSRRYSELANLLIDLKWARSAISICGVNDYLDIFGLLPKAYRTDTILELFKVIRNNAQILDNEPSYFLQMLAKDIYHKGFVEIDHIIEEEIVHYEEVLFIPEDHEIGFRNDVEIKLNSIDCEYVQAVGFYGDNLVLFDLANNYLLLIDYTKNRLYDLIDMTPILSACFSGNESTLIYPIGIFGEEAYFQVEDKQIIRISLHTTALEQIAFTESRIEKCRINCGLLYIMTPENTEIISLEDNKIIFSMVKGPEQNVQVASDGDQTLYLISPIHISDSLLKNKRLKKKWVKIDRTNSGLYKYRRNGDEECIKRGTFDNILEIDHNYYGCECAEDKTVKLCSYDSGEICELDYRQTALFPTRIYCSGNVVYSFFFIGMEKCIICMNSAVNGHFISCVQISTFFGEEMILDRGLAAVKNANNCFSIFELEELLKFSETKENGKDWETPFQIDFQITNRGVMLQTENINMINFGKMFAYAALFNLSRNTLSFIPNEIAQKKNLRLKELNMLLKETYRVDYKVFRDESDVPSFSLCKSKIQDHSPIVFAESQIMFVVGKTVFSMTDEGEIKKNKLFGVPNSVLESKGILLAVYDKYVHLLKTRKRIRFKNKCTSAAFSHPLLYVYSDEGFLTCVDVTKKKICYTEEYDIGEKPNLVAIGGFIVALCKDGTLRCHSPGVEDYIIDTDCNPNVQLGVKDSFVVCYKKGNCIKGFDLLTFKQNLSFYIKDEIRKAILYRDKLYYLPQLGKMVKKANVDRSGPAKKRARILKSDHLCAQDCVELMEYYIDIDASFDEIKLYYDRAVKCITSIDYRSDDDLKIVEVLRTLILVSWLFDESNNKDQLFLEFNQRVSNYIENTEMSKETTQRIIEIIKQIVFVLNAYEDMYDYQTNSLIRSQIVNCYRLWIQLIRIQLTLSGVSFSKSKFLEMVCVLWEIIAFSEEDEAIEKCKSEIRNLTDELYRETQDEDYKKMMEEL